MTSYWQRGRMDAHAGPQTLVFGRMYEDPAIEEAAFAAAQLGPGAKVFCIASAGCTALALAQCGYAVTAVDLNSAQIDYVNQRLAGADPREGQADRLLALGRRRLLLLGASQDALREFLELTDPAAQLAMWHQHPDAGHWHAALTAVVATLLARAAGSQTAEPAAEAARVMHERFARGLGHHPNRSNPYLWRLLLGTEPAADCACADDPSKASAAAKPAVGSVATYTADAVDFLEAVPAGSFAAFALSNLEDVLPLSALPRLAQAIAHAACPRAVLVARSLKAPKTDAQAQTAARDRSFLWGGIEVLSLHP